MKLKTLLISLLLAAAAAASAADKPVDVRDVMSASQFHATGLDTLKPDQLAAFNAWLAGYSHAPASGTAAAAVPALAPASPVVAAPVPAAPAASPTPAPAVSSSFGSEMLSADERGEAKRIESRILGTFTGWNGSTVFKLENGQVWKQTDSSTYQTKLQDPPVVIKRLGFGYLLSLTGHGATVFVRRVQ